MAKLNTKEIKTMARELIARSPGGIRYGEIVSSILGSSGFAVHDLGLF